MALSRTILIGIAVLIVIGAIVGIALASSGGGGGGVY
jgi:hypothetical protein